MSTHLSFSFTLEVFVTTPSPVEIKSSCSTCGPKSNAKVVAHHKVYWSDGPVDSWETYQIVECFGCNSVSFRHSSWCSEEEQQSYNDETGEIERSYPENILYWPPQPDPSARQKPRYLEAHQGVLDENLRQLMVDLYTALDQKLNVLAAIGARAVFECSAASLGIGPNSRTFDDKLEALLINGQISSEDRKILATLTDCGNAAAHRGWRPTTNQVNTILDITENFVHRSFILGKEARQLQEVVPQRA
jgi:hypothetical protein